MNEYISSLALRPGVSFLSIRSALCGEGSCAPYLDGRPVYSDSAHLSMSGSWLIGEKLLGTPEGTRWVEVLTATAKPRADVVDGAN